MSRELCLTPLLVEVGAWAYSCTIWMQRFMWACLLSLSWQASPGRLLTPFLHLDCPLPQGDKSMVSSTGKGSITTTYVGYNYS